jgi:hypothetical protein
MVIATSVFLVEPSAYGDGYGVSTYLRLIASTPELLIHIAKQRHCVVVLFIMRAIQQRNRTFMDQVAKTVDSGAVLIKFGPR